MLIPATRCYDRNAARAFMTSVLGLTGPATDPGDTGAIQHCELWRGTGFSIRDPEGSAGRSAARILPPPQNPA